MKATASNPDRTCMICKTELIGRSDKIFCDIKCKNKFHAELRKTKDRISNDTFKILTHNWNVLNGFMQEKGNAFVLDKLVLDQVNFNFSYSTKVSNDGLNLQFHLFEFKYKIVQNNLIYVTKEKNQSSEISPYIYMRWERKMKQLGIRSGTIT